MSELLNELISTILQIILFSLIPFIWWLITARHKERFFSWIGLKRINGTNWRKMLLMIAVTVGAFWLIGEWSLYSMKNTETADSAFTHGGIAVIPAVLVYAVLHTALTEEIFFRGFLLKRIGNRFGFVAGNTIQAVLFGTIHAVGFLNQVGFLTAVLVLCFTGGIAFVMGYINEKKAGGSIIPSWTIHAITNIISGLVTALT